LCVRDREGETGEKEVRNGDSLREVCGVRYCFAHCSGNVLIYNRLESKILCLNKSSQMYFSC